MTGNTLLSARIRFRALTIPLALAALAACESEVAAPPRRDV